MLSLRETLTDPAVWNPLLAPDGDHLAWLSTSSGRPAVHVASIVGDERVLRRDALSGHPFDCYCWAVDGESVWLLAVPDDDRDRTALLQLTPSDEVLSRTHLGEWSWLHGATGDGLVVSDWDRTVADSGDLFLVDPETSRRDRLTDYGARVRDVAVNPDGRLAYTVPESIAADEAAESTVVREVDGSLNALGADVRPVSWYGDRLLVAATEDGDTVGVHTRNGSIDWLGAGTPIGFLDEHRILATRDGVPIVLPSERELSWDHEPVTGGSARGQRAAFATASSDHNPGRVLLWDEETVATVASPEYPVPPADLPDPQSVTYSDSEGVDHDAWLLLPEARPAPCVVHLYGGFPGRGDFDRKFGRPFRYLREQGYAVAVPAHGGERFDERRHADYAAAATWATRQEWSDGTAVALGHSSGGYDVLMQAVRHPEPWTAGVAWNGIADLRGFYEVMEKSRDRIERQLGDDGLDRLNALSPAGTDVSGFPLLVLQGEHDWMTDQVRDFVTDQRTAGADIEYEEIRDTAHWTRDLDVRVRIWRRIEEFLERTS